MQYYCDKARHLVCMPFSIENLHLMARNLNLKRCWFHSHPRHPHYDIPKRRITEIMQKCTLVSSSDILDIINLKYIE